MSKVVTSSAVALHNSDIRKRISSPLLGRVLTQSNEDNLRTILGRAPVSIVPGRDATLKSCYYICADGSNFRGILKFDTSNNVFLSVAAGSSTGGSADGTGALAQFNNPTGIAYNSTENALYICDRANNKIRRMDCYTFAVTTVMGSGTAGSVDGVGTAAQLRAPWGIVIDEANQVGYFTEYFPGTASFNRLRSFTIPGYTVSTLNSATPNVNQYFCDVKLLKGIAGSGRNYLYIAANTGILQRTVGLNAPTNLIQIVPSTTLGYVDGTFALAQFNSIRWLAVSQADQTLYASETLGNRVRRIQLGLPNSTLGVSTVAGDIAATAGATGNVNATGTSARFNSPQGLTVTPEGYLLVCDNVNNSIRRIN